MLSRAGNDKIFAVEFFNVNGDRNALRSELARRLFDKGGIFDGGGIDGHFVRACQQQIADVVQSADSAPDGKRNKDVFGDAFHDVNHCFASVVCRRDVQQNQFVGALFGIAFRQIHSIARKAQVFEIHAFDGLSVFDVQARNNAFCNHANTHLFSVSRPVCPLFSG